MTLYAPVPILRIFDEAQARAFYVDYLGFRIVWEHRFDDDAPLYLQAEREGCVLHLSGHHGDCCPGAALRIETDALDALHAELGAKGCRHARPGIESMPWNCREMTLRDPFGNRLVFTDAAG